MRKIDCKKTKQILLKTHKNEYILTDLIEEIRLEENLIISSSGEGA